MGPKDVIHQLSWQVATHLSAAKEAEKHVMAARRCPTTSVSLSRLAPQLFSPCYCPLHARTVFAVSFPARSVAERHYCSCAPPVLALRALPLQGAQEGSAHAAPKISGFGSKHDVIRHDFESPRGAPVHAFVRTRLCMGARRHIKGRHPTSLVWKDVYNTL
jgi:hypothetical protein